MKQTTVDVREIKARLFRHLRIAKAGEAVEITERGVASGRIVPVAAPIEDRLGATARSGFLQWDERRLARTAPVATACGSRSVADLLIDDRG